MLIAFAILALLGFVAAICVLLRQRQPGEPRCDACGYDLRGQPSLEREASPRCPECGADLAAPGAIRTVRPVPVTPKAILVALASVLVMCSPVLFRHWSESQRTPVIRVATTTNDADLLKGLTEGDPWSAVFAWSELDRRLNAGSLAPRDVDRSIALLIVAAGRNSGRLDVLPSDAMRFAQDVDVHGLFTPETFGRFSEAYFGTTDVKYSPTALARSATPLRVIDAIAMQPFRTIAGTQLTRTLVGANIDEAPQPLAIGGSNRATSGLDRSIFFGRVTLPASGLPLGRHTIVLLIESDVSTPGSPPTVRHHWINRVTLQLDVVPDGTTLPIS